MAILKYYIICISLDSLRYNEPVLLFAIWDYSWNSSAQTTVACDYKLGTLHFSLFSSLSFLYRMQDNDAVVIPLFVPVIAPAARHSGLISHDFGKSLFHLRPSSSLDPCFPYELLPKRGSLSLPSNFTCQMVLKCFVFLFIEFL